MKKPVDVEKVLSRMSDSKKKLAASSKDIALGKHAVALIAKEGEISVATLKSSLVQVIETSPSVRGECDADQDFQRMAAQEALDYLESLLKQHGG